MGDFYQTTDWKHGLASLQKRVFGSGSPDEVPRIALPCPTNKANFRLCQ